MPKSYLNNTSLPRGLRNNNPGNIRLVQSNNWNGKISFAQNRDYSGSPTNIVKEFEQFSSLKYGIRAKLVLIYNHITKGKNTIEKLIHVYAPPFENDTIMYINSVAKALKINKNSNIELTGENLIALAKAISTVENGKAYDNYITDKDYQEALAILDRPLKKKVTS